MAKYPPLLAAPLALLVSGCIMLPVYVPIDTRHTKTTTTDPAEARPVTAWPASATCPIPPDSAANARTLAALINSARTDQGLPPLHLSAPLSEVAHRHACDNAAHQTTSHTGSDGSTLQTRLDRGPLPYAIAAENTGLGFAAPETAFAFWMQSPGHRANILAQDITQLGIGQANGTPSPTWVLNFTLPR